MTTTLGNIKFWPADDCFDPDKDYVMPLRYICDILAEMRKCHETRNYSYLLALIEEAQMRADRMEAALGGKHEIEHLEERIKKLDKEWEAKRERNKALPED
jgi:hypothetical protein